MSTYLVSALIKANPEKDIALIRIELKKLVQATLKEKGCLRFECLEDLNTLGVFSLWEEFENKEALDQHFKEPATVAFFEQNLTSVLKVNFLKMF